MRRFLRLAIVPAFALGLAACDGTADSSAPSALSASEAQLAATLVGQALGDQSEGMVSDLRDMDAGVEASGLVYGEGPMGRGHRPGNGNGNGNGTGNGGPGAGNDWRGPRQDGTVTYDPATGTHRVVYDRSMQTPVGTNTLRADLAYVFTDSLGAFLRTPRTDRARVFRIVFDGERAGASRRTRPGSSASDTSSFSREATWTLSGLTRATSTFAGDQTSTGSGAFTTDSGVVRLRSYTVRLRTANATITRSATTTGGGRPEQALTGTIAYETVFTRTLRDGTTEQKRAEGTIDLATDGRALMRFMGLDHRFDLDLSTGGASKKR